MSSYGRYMSDYSEVSDYETDLQNTCKVYDQCGEIIRPEQTAVMMNPYVDIRGVRHRVEMFFHKDCIEDAEEYTGEEIMED